MYTENFKTYLFSVLTLLLLGTTSLWSQYHHVTGYVTNSSGGGVWNVDIDVEDSFTGDPLNIENDHTDPNGYYDIILPTGTFNIEYNTPLGLKLVSEIRRDVVVSGNLTINVTLEDGYYLYGRVTDSLGAGVNKVDIDVDDAETGLRIPTPRDDTNPNGEYQVVVPDKLIDVTYEPPLGVRLVAVMIPGVQISGDKNIDVTLEDGYFVSGWAVDESGVGLQDIDLDAEDFESGQVIPTPRDNTNEGGYYLIVLPGGMFSITFDPLRRDDLAAVRLDTVWIESDTVIDTVIIPAGVKLSGKVTDSQGTPLEGADLDVIDPSTQRTIPTPRDNTDEQGNYQVTIIPAVYDLHMHAPQGSGLGNKFIAMVSVLHDTTVNFVLEESSKINEDESGNTQNFPKGVLLLQNYPNPFNPRTTISFSIPSATNALREELPDETHVRLEIFDLRGHRVRLLLDSMLAPGTHQITWDGRDDRGTSVPSGIFLYRLQYGDYEEMRKMAIQK